MQHENATRNTPKMKCPGLPAPGHFHVETGHPDHSFCPAPLCMPQSSCRIIIASPDLLGKTIRSSNSAVFLRF